MCRVAAEDRTNVRCRADALFPNSITLLFLRGRALLVCRQQRLHWPVAAELAFCLGEEPTAHVSDPNYQTLPSRDRSKKTVVATPVDSSLC
jgi:hypothetical protein